MTHSASITRSPSSLSLTCSTPCVDGCCGPMLIVISLASNSVSLVDIFRLVLWRHVVAFFSSGLSNVVLLTGFNTGVLADPFHILQPEVVILAQRKSLPVFGQENSLQVRMVRITNTEHVVHLALQPVRCRPDRNNTLDRFPFLDAALHTYAIVCLKRI